MDGRSLEGEGQGEGNGHVPKMATVFFHRFGIIILH